MNQLCCPCGEITGGDICPQCLNMRHYLPNQELFWDKAPRIKPRKTTTTYRNGRNRPRPSDKIPPWYVRKEFIPHRALWNLLGKGKLPPSPPFKGEEETIKSRIAEILNNNN